MLTNSFYKNGKLCLSVVAFCGKVRMIPIPVQIGFRIKNRNPDPGPKVTDPGPKVPDPGPKVPDPNLL